MGLSAARASASASAPHNRHFTRLSLWAARYGLVLAARALFIVLFQLGAHGFPPARFCDVFGAGLLTLNAPGLKARP